MTIRKLTKLLKYNVYVYVNTWNDVRNIVDVIPKCKIIKKEWLGKYDYKNNTKYYDLDLSDIKVWSTYDNESCIDIRFTLTDNSELLCKAKIYDGHMTDGERKEVRFYAEFLVPLNFIKNLETDILRQTKFNLKNDYDKYLENLRTNWIKNNFEKLINE